MTTARELASPSEAAGVASGGRPPIRWLVSPRYDLFFFIGSAAFIAVGFLVAALSTHYFVFFATVTPFPVAEALDTAYHLEIVGLTHPGWAYAFTPFTMLVLFHYYIDGKVWKLRRYPELRAMLAKP